MFIFFMVDEKFMLLSLEDPKMKSLSDVLGNKTCKKIIDYLAEHEEASQKDLSDALNVPINTIEYNIKKLVESGLVQKRKNFFWSKKGKKIVMYELSNKSIVISPKKSFSHKLKSLIPSALLVLSGSVLIYAYEKILRSKRLVVNSGFSEKIATKGADLVFESTHVANSAFGAGASDVISEAGKGLLYYPPSPLWVWFLAGGLLVMFIFAVLNWRKL